MEKELKVTLSSDGDGKYKIRVREKESGMENEAEFPYGRDLYGDLSAWLGKEVHSWVSLLMEETDGAGEEPECGNTRIYYQYRDASNYKKENSVVVAGRMTRGQMKKILGSLNSYDKCEGTGYFIPRQVGLPEERFDGPPTEDDHCWFELWDGAFCATADSPTVDMSAEELAEAFGGIGPAGWDDVTYAVIA